MPLNRGTVNPLNLFNCRKLSYIPSHFTKIVLHEETMVDKLDYWIYNNLNSMYCIKSNIVVDSTNRMKERFELGIEDGKELTMLSLSCPHFRP